MSLIFFSIKPYLQLSRPKCSLRCCWSSAEVPQQRQRFPLAAAQTASGTRPFFTPALEPLSPLLQVSNLICARASGDDTSLDKLFYCPIDLLLMNTLP